MNKFTMFFGLLALSALLAGLFGAVHNVLSYAVGPSYFHDMKFAQFGISDEAQTRLGAALVGWRASWWMGVIGGVPAFALGFFLLARPQTFLVVGIGAIVVAILVTTLATVAGLAFGVTRIDETYVQTLALPENVSDPVGFARADVMHDMAYYGAILGAVLGLLTIWRSRKAEERTYGG